jgi:hypothetical protein
MELEVTKLDLYAAPENAPGFMPESAVRHSADRVGGPRGPQSLVELSREKPIVGANAAVQGAKRYATGRAVGDKQSVEWITGPVQPQGMANKGCQRDIVDRESRIVHHSVRELRVTNREALDLGEKLDFEKGNRRHPPGTIPVQPRKFSKPLRSQDEPDQKVGVEEQGHRARRRRETRPRSGPRHSHDHRSASSASGTRRSRLYCRAPAPSRMSSSSSRRSTSRRPFRLTTITSPRRASSRRRNQCFLASDAVTFFICTTYKTWRSGVKAASETRPG